MGDMLAASSIFNENRAKIVWYVPSDIKQIFWVQFVYFRGNNIEIFQKVQKDEILRNDDFPAKYADKGLDIIRSGHSDRISFRIPKLFLKMMVYKSSFLYNIWLTN